MSLDASGNTSLRAQPTSSDPDSEHQITLLDHTEPASEDTGPASGSPKGSDQALYRKFTKNSLQQQLAQRKYKRYREERFPDSDEPSASTADDLHDSSSRLQRGRKRITGHLKTKKERSRAAEEDSAIDILYENQRGSFLFGIPLFSSKSLLNFDPAPWINGYKKRSPVNITNAQVPDPSWEWAWNSWYVDMSRDVDEEGWEYSFSFRSGFAWHGTHPWFHSFVRRRRWLRKRVRKHTHHAHGQTVSQKHMSEAHMLTADYFTIHSSRNKSPDSSQEASLVLPSGLPRLKRDGEDENHEVPLERAGITDIGTLMARLRKAAIDREKLAAVRMFMDYGGDETYYLAEQMPNIMSLFIFQSSRRQLLATLMHRFDAASRHRHEHTQSERAESDEEKRRIDNLLRAVRVADEEVKRLEYWSDIRSMARHGEILGATDESRGWSAHGWQGLDSSGPASNERTAAKEAGHPNTEDVINVSAVGGGMTGDETPAAENTGTRSTENGDASAVPHETLPAQQSSAGERRQESSESTAYVTPAEEPRKIDKGKMRA
ncbi:hypothetical protein LTR66_010055 [Elasticomyces elasticus]|nr:hypothetical protein LTR66_010055 [Elasticomyces elasticus]